MDTSASALLLPRRAENKESLPWTPPSEGDGKLWRSWRSQGTRPCWWYEGRVFHFPRTKITCVKQRWGHQRNLLRHNPRSMERCGRAQETPSLFPPLTLPAGWRLSMEKHMLQTPYSPCRLAFPSTQKSKGIRKTLSLIELFRLGFFFIVVVFKN